MDSFSYLESGPSTIFRRISVVFSGTALIGLVVFYYVADIRFELPSIKYEGVIKKGRWSAIESNLHPIESELTKQVLSEFNSTNINVTANSHKYFPLRKRAKYALQERRKPVMDKNFIKYNSTVLNISSCALQKQTVPETDIQMLSMFDKIIFDDTDGGVWKQGWNITYNEDQWNRQNKLKVFIVPHSHNDPGWIMTFENYYSTKTRNIFENMVERLSEGIGRKFIWSEISFLALWWDVDASNDEKVVFKDLIKSKKIEIVTGGWVMNDEANSHWLSTIQQLTLGHQWCLYNLGITPKNAWSIDPFGYSSSQPYLLKLAGLDNSIIQRVHYIVKKELASHRQLEFRWRQLWDGVGKTDMFTHMLPFFSYDVPHSCGPDPKFPVSLAMTISKAQGQTLCTAGVDRTTSCLSHGQFYVTLETFSYIVPKICCQFDFIRLQGTGVSCPWGIEAQNITQKNVDERATLLVDQWRKKAQLYRSNVVLFPLGDDVRYQSYLEWDYQFQNYGALINYINNNEALNTEVQFGNLEDYFKALHAEVKLSDFPVLSGDFFTYADRQQHYWSGYFTSRPFYKYMDRVLLSYLRAAEIISSQAMSVRLLSRLIIYQLENRLAQGRNTLSLFQHHDAIGGTSTNAVVKNYAMKMVKAIQQCQTVIQQAVHYLLKQPSILERTRDVIFFGEFWRRPDEIPSRTTIILDTVTPIRKISLYNSLPFTRHEILTVFTSSAYVEISDFEGNPIKAQVSPAVLRDKRLNFADYKYQVSFPVVVNSLALTTITVKLTHKASIQARKYTSYSRIRVYNVYQRTVDLPKVFQVEQSSARLKEDITIQSGNSTKIVTTMNGLIKAIVSPEGTVVPVRMDFAKYDSQSGRDNNSGAYLFLPSGPAEQFQPESFPEIIVTEGIFKSTLYTALNSPEAADVVVATSIYNNPSLQQSEIEICNTLLIDPQVDNLELAMRFSTDIKNGDVFFTDANGMQMIKRRSLGKLPIQANYYPLSAAAYIEDDRYRLTVLTSTPLGVAALRPGQIEVMQDRRLSEDDSRGLGQGVLDNVKTRHTFKLIIENANKPCPLDTPAEHPSGQLTLGSHVSQQFLLQPLIVMHHTALDKTLHDGYSGVTLNAADLVLASYQSSVYTKDKDGTILRGMGVIFQRVYLDPCYGNKEITKWYQISDGQILMSELVNTPEDSVYESTLTFTSLKDQLPDGILTLCPQEVRSVFINKTFKTLE